ncbi:MAG: ubiquitin-like small modifier protein 1 [Candidatus Promineifilaceae bacterium]|nr:ubiquitin-like small modifier protein 1 [Candidatus Promineifilaceae bacterium]
MQITLYANLRQIAGQRTVAFDWHEPVTVEELIAKIVSRYPAMAEALLTEDGRLSEHVRIFADGRDILTAAEPESVLLPAQARIDLFPAIAGGQ